MKKVFKIVLLILGLGLAAFLLWRLIGYLSDRNPDKNFLLPRVELSIVEITNMTAEKVDFNLTMLVDNNLPVAFNADSIDYRMFVDSVEVIRDRYPQRIELEVGDTSVIVLPVTLLADDLTKVLEENEARGVDSIEYRLQMSFHSDVVVKEDFDIDIARRLPLIYIPEVVAQKLEIDSLSLSEVEMTMHLSVNNKNDFPIHAKDIQYRFAIAENEWVVGNMPGLTRIVARDTTHIHIPATITLKEVRQSFFDVVFKANQVEYALELKFRVQSKNETVSNSDFILKSEGSLKSLRKTMKEVRAEQKKK